MHDTVYQYPVKLLYEFQEAFWIEEVWEYYINSWYIPHHGPVIGDSRSISYMKATDTREFGLKGAIRFIDPEQWIGYYIE